MSIFTPIELDVITELTNIGVGRAAAFLSELVGKEIDLTVPGCEIVSRPEAVKYLESRIKTDIIGVKESFNGSFEGNGLLLFPKKDSLELVRSLVPEDTPLENLSEFEQDALVEIGNIILNACIGTYSNMLQQQLMTELPKYIKGNCRSLLADYEKDCPEEKQVMILDVSFSIKTRNIRGYVIFVMDLVSEDYFHTGIRNYVNKLAITA